MGYCPYFAESRKSTGMKRAAIRVKGIVQGVGFRPFVYRLARQFGLTGWVLNDEQGVLIEVQGSERILENFQANLPIKAPSMAKIEEIVTDFIALQEDETFIIKESISSAGRETFISPDIATCSDCRHDLSDPKNRRFGYAFTNCTNCGPRYSIIKDVPYDRPQTTMKPFVMCNPCQAEYDNPEDRRFHAQPNACPNCGPLYELLDQNGNEMTVTDPVQRAHSFIKQGSILAVKGIGGYHLACDAKNSSAVRSLRSRKIREDKPFAVMCGSIEAVRRICFLSTEEEILLTGPIGPIVLLRKRAVEILAADIAGGNPYLGVMLPYAPLHFLLLKPADIFVMTSGNQSGEPIVYKDNEVYPKLKGIADYFLVHNREIHCRVDDSVVRVFHGQPYLLRRSRGLAPAPIHLHKAGLSVLACGGETKNTFCLTKGREAFVSEHIGDLENQQTLLSYQKSIEHYQCLFDIDPEVAVYDLHPEYLSTKYAKQLSIPAMGVQHHYAHIASVLAEHNFNDSVIGVAFDGTGYGDDGTLWGGEFLLADLHSYERLAHCAYLPLPGGEKAVRQPWRQAVWILQDIYGVDFLSHKANRIKNMPNGWELMLQATAQGINAPLSSSAGRLFDTAAALLGLRLYNNYEGQAAVELELAAHGAVGKVLPYDITSTNEIDFRATFAALTNSQAAIGDLAAAFHTTIADAIVVMIRRLHKITGVSTVALSGGVFQNMTLLQQVIRLLEMDFTVLLNRQVPPNDGGLSLGQAAVARERRR